MKKTNLKIIVAFIIGIIISSTISVAAAYGMVNANKVAYSDNGSVSNVETALNTLYDSIDVATILPTGSIIPYMGNTAPENYLICDGSVYNINDYKKLADHIKNNFGSYNKFGGDGTTTFAVPDLRGEFLRGAGTNSHANQGNGAAVGNHQDATEQPHIFAAVKKSGSGIYLDFGYSANNIHYSDSNYNYNAFYNPDTAKGRTANIAVAGTLETLSNSGWGAYTARPTNTSVNYIIKVK